LKRHCETKLSEAQAKVDKIVLAPDGTVSAAPADQD
jgi:exodeoxyribonuclease VII small subunit